MKGCLSLHEYIEIAGAVDEKEDEKKKTHVRFPLRQKRRQNNSSYMRTTIRKGHIFHDTIKMRSVRSGCSGKTGVQLTGEKQGQNRLGSVMMVILPRVFVIMTENFVSDTTNGKGVAIMKNFRAFMVSFLFILFAGNAGFAGELDIQHYFDEGNNYFNEGKYDKAIASYSRLIALYPDYNQGYYNRGLAYYKVGKYDEAIADYSRVISSTSGNDDLYNNRAIAYLRKGDYENAIRDYTTLISLNSRFPDAYHNRGIAYANVGRYDEAIADYDRVISLKPKDPNIYFSRGVAYAKKAMVDFRRGCDMGNQLACENLKQLSK